MVWIKRRLAAFSWAKGHKAWLFTAGVLFLAAAVTEIWPQIQGELSDWAVVLPPNEGAGMTILGHPAWSLFVILGLGCLCAWLFESMVRIHGELSPKLNPLFDPDTGGLTTTVLTDPSTLKTGDPVKYVRLSVNSASRKSVRECVANLVKIERRLDLESTEILWDHDALPLRWAMTGEYETKIHYLTKRYVDIARVKKAGQLEVLTIIPNRLAADLVKVGVFLLTVVVTGNGVSSDPSQIEIETDGTYEGFKVRAI